jgi:hypothetical protein
MFSRPKETEEKIVKGKHTRLDDDDDDEVEELEEDDDELTESESLSQEEEEEEEEDFLQSGLKQEINKMSFEEVQKLQNKLGLKKYEINK